MKPARFKPERFRWIAAVIFAHPGHTVYGRTRLQKEMLLLQRCGLPADYDFRMHYYGPYSDGIQSDLNLLDRMKLVSQEPAVTEMTGKRYTIFTASKEARMDAMDDFQGAINRMADTDTVVLELAATYDAFYEKVNDHDRARSLLGRMKKDKCTEERVRHAMKLLSDLGLPSAPADAA